VVGLPGAGATHPPSQIQIFLNHAFDSRREYLYLSLIGSLASLGLRPRSVVELPGDTSRLERLHALIRACQYSVHDLSAVELTVRPYRVPRFNMPFELGLAVALKLQGEHEFRLLEAVDRRLDQSLSDLKGYDPYIHGATPIGVFDAVRNMFSALDSPPTRSRADFHAVYEALLDVRRSREGRGNPYTAVQFGSLVTAANTAVRRLRSVSRRS
jgi:hypothetical protein